MVLILDGSNFQCAICLGTVRDCRTASCCAGMFCASCIQPVISSNEPCPKCRTPNESVKYERNQAIQRLANEIDVECPDCQQTLKHGDLANGSGHESVCPSREVECPHWGCNWEGKRNALQTHLTEDHASEAVQAEPALVTRLQHLVDSKSSFLTIQQLSNHHTTIVNLRTDKQLLENDHQQLQIQQQNLTLQLQTLQNQLAQSQPGQTGSQTVSQPTSAVNSNDSNGSNNQIANPNSNQALQQQISLMQFQNTHMVAKMRAIQYIWPQLHTNLQLHQQSLSQDFEKLRSAQAQLVISMGYLGLLDLNVQDSEMQINQLMQNGGMLNVLNQNIVWTCENLRATGIEVSENNGQYELTPRADYYSGGGTTQ